MPAASHDGKGARIGVLVNVLSRRSIIFTLLVLQSRGFSDFSSQVMIRFRVVMYARAPAPFL